MKPQTEEQIATACTTTNLRDDVSKSNVTDNIKALALSHSQIGRALLRIRAEVDCSGGSPAVSKNALRVVVQALTRQCVRWKIQNEEKLVTQTIEHWLRPTCKVCHGRGHKLINGTPVLGTNKCEACHGSGQRRIPNGLAGQRLWDYLNDCLARGVQLVKHKKG